jgi:hypothetical protein
MRGPDMISETDRLKRTSRLCIVDMIGWVMLGDHNLARLLLLLAPSEKAIAKGENQARNEIAP